MSIAHYGQYPNSLGPVKKPKTVRIGGANNYAIRGTTLVEGYFPGPMRQNFRQDPNYMIGKVSFGTFGNDQNFNGPGSLLQALPDGSRFQYKQIFMPPRPNINKEVGLDDRQLASYQVEQLHVNPLSQYTTNPDAPIPGFFCDSEPDNFSTMINERETQAEKWFKDLKPNNYVGASQVPGRAAGSAPNVYEQYTGAQANPNADVVYNLSLNSKEQYNPMISMGSSGVATSNPEFSGSCYSGRFVPGYKTSTSSGSNPPTVYGPNKEFRRTQGDVGFMNPGAYNSNTICEGNPSINFANPLVL